MSEMTHETFNAILGETVTLEAEGVRFEAKVKTVRLLRQQPGQERQPFAVDLWSPGDEYHAQQIYALSHPELGELSLFLVPVGEMDGGLNYEIVFN